MAGLSWGLLKFIHTLCLRLFSTFFSKIARKHHKQRLYTNNRVVSDDFNCFPNFGRSRSFWSHVIFEHPARFDTLLIEPKLKEEIVNDLAEFTKSRDYYAKMGKPWKRGYLLYGPPGTGKSSMVAAMANLLGYDVYDIELTAIKDNAEMRQLMLSIPSKSIVLFEDIDRRSGCKVTSSGLWNFSDGIWSSVSGGEKIVVFTAQQIDKLDSALIRKGRMDKRVQFAHCTPSMFKILAKKCLDIESHALFDKIEKLLDETDVTPADVADQMRPKIISGIDVDGSLERLIKALEDAKEEADRKAEEGEEKNDSTPSKFKHAKGSKRLPTADSKKVKDKSYLSYYI